ncbi:unnamed protein product [Ixodes pacificus]
MIIFMFESGMKCGLCAACRLCTGCKLSNQKTFLFLTPNLLLRSIHWVLTVVWKIWYIECRSWGFKVTSSELFLPQRSEKEPDEKLDAKITNNHLPGLTSRATPCSKLGREELVLKTAPLRLVPNT